jgi:enoyl-CoA hydratase
MEESLVILTQENDIAILTINRPRAFNAINREVLKAFSAILDRLETSMPKAVILTGQGEKAFIAGADIQEMSEMGPLEATGFSRMAHRVLARLSALPVPIIAAMNGHTLGGGLEFALACDIRVAEEKATLGFPEVTLGIIPGWGGTQRLTRLVGTGKAMDLILTGRRIKAPEAHNLGIVEHVVENGKALESAKALVKEIPGARVAIANAKMAITQGNFEQESLYFGQCFATFDQKEGMQAFSEKRSAQFKGI